MHASICAYHDREPQEHVSVFAFKVTGAIQITIGYVTHFMTPAQFDQFRADVDRLQVQDLDAEDAAAEVNHVGI